MAENADTSNVVPPGDQTEITEALQQLRDRNAELQQRVKSYERLLENTPDLFYRTDLDGRITYISPSVLRLSGYTVAEAIGMKMAEEVYQNPEERLAFLTLLKENGRVSNFEAGLRRRDGSVWQASTNAHWLLDSDGNIVGVEGITRDISELKTTLRSLQSMEERFRLAFQTNPDAININRAADGVYIDINDGFTELTGYTRADVIGKSSLEINIWNNVEDRNRLVAGLRTQGYVKNLEAEFRMKDGAVHVGLMSARFLTMDNQQCILSITRNIADLKTAQREKERLEAELSQSQKMEAIGRLAGGIAHDLNNQLVPILGYADLLERQYSENVTLCTRLNVISKAAEEARDLVQQLLAFSRKQTLAYKYADLNELLREFEMLVRRTIREDIEIRLRLAPFVVGILADTGQMKQVIMNLVVNAVDSMPRGGVLTVETSEGRIGMAGGTLPLKVALERCAILTIRDTGEGMDEATRQRIFEPFFSTKGEGGTGLGLSTVYGIVRQHEGDIQVESEPGRGTAFRVFLPIAPPVSTGAEAPGEPVWDATGNEIVCLVEDNQLVREMTEEILADCGYRVLTAANGAAALALVRDEPRIDLLLTDVIMPGMNGTALFKELSGRFPRMKVLYMSGYPDDIVARHGAPWGRPDGTDGTDGTEVKAALIQKPFTPGSLSAEIRRVLDS
ncbi:MAG: PAS domain S-box protein [Deltaproteobacteria bacterium]|nr:PAS domain S-box protein [Deltaproteobacteria bacterium]